MQCAQDSVACIYGVRSDFCLHFTAWHLATFVRAFALTICGREFLSRNEVVEEILSLKFDE